MYRDELEKRECNECGCKMDKEEMERTNDEWLCPTCYHETEAYLQEKADFYYNMQADAVWKER